MDLASEVGFGVLKDGSSIDLFYFFLVSISLRLGYVDLLSSSFIMHKFDFKSVALFLFCSCCFFLRSFTQIWL